MASKDQGTVTNHLPDLGKPAISGTLYVCLYPTGLLSVLLGVMDPATKRMKFDSIFRGDAPADLTPELPCVLGFAAQLAHDRHHAPW